MKIKWSGKNLVIDNGIYVCTLSRDRGGSMVKLTYGGVDMMVKREGCECWTKTDHYEQEFGETREMYFSIDNDGMGANAIAKSTLVSPQTKKLGGDCIVGWKFNGSRSIYSWATINPKYPSHIYDRYVCFGPMAYCKYVRAGDGELETGDFIERWKPWFGNHAIKGDGEIKLTNAKNTIAYRFGGPSNTIVYQSPTMIEIKVEYPDRKIIAVEFEGR